MGASQQGRGRDLRALRVPGAERRPGVEGLTEIVRVQAERIAVLETIIELAPVGIGVVDLEGRAPLTNDTLRQLLGYSAEEFAAMTFSEFSHPDDDEANMPLFAKLREGRIDRFTMEKRLVRKDGRLLWTALTVSLVRDDDGQPSYGIGMTQDISERRELERKLQDAERHYRLLVERVPAVVYTAEAGPAGRWHYVSPQIEQLLGFTPEEWMADENLWFSRLVEEDRAAALASELGLARMTVAGPGWATYRLRHRDGTVVWVRDAAMARAGRGGDVVLDGVLFDVTQEKFLEEELARQAKHDPLTGLVNRGHFRELVDNALALAAETGAPVALLFIDLDGFKAVNDTLGHGTGDQVLATVAGRLVFGVPDDAVLARLGGDEFAVLLQGRHTRRLHQLASRLLGIFAEPVPVQGVTVRVGASIGASIAGPDDTTDSLLHRADQAMYRAKSDGGDGFVLSD
ncbi:MAG: sensor diguanylate cyclase [Actinotalea sp.]|nr:sensor diguanylate cyclase [Actinotalea sp.]